MALEAQNIPQNAEGFRAGIEEQPLSEFDKVHRGNELYIGPPGIGKTTQVRRRAERTGKKYKDMDTMIEERAGMPIPAIFKLPNGEKHFRDLESSILRELMVFGNNILVSAGGGIFEREENVGYAFKNSIVIYQRGTPRTAAERAFNDPDKRPGLTIDDDGNLKNFDEVLETEETRIRNRSRLYEKADIIIDVDGLSEDETSDVIDREIGAYKKDPKHAVRIVTPSRRSRKAN